MKFNLDNPFIQFLTKVANLILVNVIFIICSVPIITMGASITAMCKVTQSIVYDTETGIFKAFFLAFKENFKQATIVWLVTLFFSAGMVCNVMLVSLYFTGTIAMVLDFLLGLIVVLALAIASYIFPLIARYRNTLREHFNNSLILAVIKLPRTLLMIFLNALPLILLMLSMNAFIQTLIFWFFIGFAFVSFCNSHLLKPVMDELESGDTSNIRIMR